MAEKPLNNSEENKSAAQSNIEVGKIEVGGNVGGSIIVGHNINITPERQVFLSLHQLPQPPADFTGREELIAQLIADFEKGKGATITGQPIHGLTGMGGIGKTALGLVVAHQIAKDYPDAQIFLDLKGTTTPLSAMEIMRHVILSFEPTVDLSTLDEANLSAAYQSVLHGKKVLLFFDNARSAEQIALLRPPETCALLVTSRWLFSVPGLHIRRVDVMSEANARAFLLELCHRIGDAEQAAPELAKACAYLPLALRIAGSFLQVNNDWSVEKYIATLNDRKQRLAILEQSHKDAELTTEPTLLAAFELSYRQLSEENRKHWRMLGVFPASFNWIAASAMWGLNEAETLKNLGLLLRYSLLDYDEAFFRYSLHDLLADYALSQLGAEEEQEARLKHASHYKDVLSAADEIYLEGGENVLTGLHLLNLEWENIQTGQAWVAAGGHDRVTKELCVAYPDAGASVLSLRRHPRERIRWLERAVSAAREIGDRQGEGKALGNLGAAYQDFGETGKAIEFYQQALVIIRESGNRRFEGIMLGNLGVAYQDFGETGKAIELYEQDLAIAQETADRRGESTALHNIGNAYRSSGEIHKAIKFLERALVIDREIGDRRGEGDDLGSLGNAYADLGEVRKAIELYQQRFVIAQEIGDLPGVGYAAFNTGLALYKLEKKEKAIDLVKDALELFEAIESPDAERARDTLKEWGAL